MTNNQTIKIAIPSAANRDWTTISQIKEQFTEDEIVTMVHRYCDAQDHAKNYRVKRAETVKAVMALAKERGLLSEVSGTRVSMS